MSTEYESSGDPSNKKFKIRKVEVPAIKYVAVGEATENLIRFLRETFGMEKEFKIKGTELEYPPAISVIDIEGRAPIVHEWMYKLVSGRGALLPNTQAHVIAVIDRDREIHVKKDLESLISEVTKDVTKENALTITSDDLNKRHCIYLYKECKCSEVPRYRLLINICTLGESGEKELKVLEDYYSEGLEKYRACITGKKLEGPRTYRSCVTAIPEECELEAIDPKKLLNSKENLYNSIQDVAKTIVGEKKDPLINEEARRKVLDLLLLLEEIYRRDARCGLIESYIYPLGVIIAELRKMTRK